MMGRPILAVVILATVYTIAVQGQSPAAKGTATSGSPTVIAAEHFDVSPPLRDIPPVAEPGAPVRELPRHPHRGRRGAHDPNAVSNAGVQDFFGSASAPAMLHSIEGINNIDFVLPPDTNGDVGPNHYVQWVNLSFAVYSKGTDTTPPALIYGPVPGRTLWTGFGGPCETRNDGDPIVLYDHLADRWFFSQFAIPNSFLGILFGPFYHCIAISATPDPTGAYYRYQFALDKLGDYPKFGVWPDGYYMTVNQFQEITLQFAGQGVAAFDRDRMLAGQPASMVYFDMEGVDASLGGMLPSDLDGPAPPSGTPNYFVQMDDDASGVPEDRLQLWRFHVDWNAPLASTFSRLALLPTMPFDSNMCGYERSCVPQPGTSAKLDAISDRLMYRLQYRNFGDHDALVTNHTVDVDGTDHAGIRWYEIRNPGTSPQIFQQGTYAPDSDHRWMASAAMDGFGNLGIGFAVSGASWPSVRHTGRLVTDPPDVLTQGEGEIVAGSGAQTHSSSRFGDYSMLAVDPVDDCTFWYTQEYYAVTSEAGWQTRIGTFRFPACETVSTLPAVTVTASTPQATEAGPTSGVFTVTRGGDTSAALTVHYSVSGTAVAGTDYVSLPSTVTIDAGSAAATITVTPIDDVALESDESVVLSLSADAAYRVGSPSAGIVTIVSDDLPPDLIVVSVTAPSLAGADADIVVTDTTKNQGAGPSMPSTTGFFLSTNTTLDGADVFLGSRPVPLLGPGATDLLSTTLHIAPSTVPGSYYVLAKADWDSAVDEDVETNNVKASGVIKIGPDLIVSAVTAPAGAAAGSTISVSDTTKNQGGGGAAASSTGFYLSTNTTLGSTDVFLGSRPAGELAANGTSTASTPLDIPADTAAGTYYVVTKADWNSFVAETVETNNTRASAIIRIGGDLVVSSVSAPATGKANGPITVTDVTKNQGGTPVPESATGFYLSLNTSYSSNDVFLGSRVVGSLGPSGTETASTPLIIPAGTATGSYYVIAVADFNGLVAEISETNNTRASSVLRIGPDMIVSALTAPTSAVAGTTVSATDTTRNQGGDTAPESVTRFYLSTNSSLDAADVLLATRTVPSLGSGLSNAGSASLPIPSSTTAGSYYIIAKADGDETVVETLENNNARTKSISITAAPSP